MESVGKRDRNRCLLEICGYLSRKGRKDGRDEMSECTLKEPDGDKERIRKGRVENRGWLISK